MYFFRAARNLGNAKPLVVALEIRQALDEDTANAKIVKSNHRTTRKSGDYGWRFTVPRTPRATSRTACACPKKTS